MGKWYVYKSPSGKTPIPRKSKGILPLILPDHRFILYPDSTFLRYLHPGFWLTLCFNNFRLSDEPKLLTSSHLFFPSLPMAPS